MASLSAMILPLRPVPPASDLLTTLAKVQAAVLKSLSVSTMESGDEVTSPIDEWERQYTRAWLVRVAVRATEILEDEEDDESQAAWEDVANQASHLVGLLSDGTAVSQPFSRFYTFELCLPMTTSIASSLSYTITVEIRDAALSYSAIGSQTWNAAPLLCKRLCADPGLFFARLFKFLRKPCVVAQLPFTQSMIAAAWEGIDTPPYTRPSSPGLEAPLPILPPDTGRCAFRVLELGSGTGLVGITTGAILASILASSPIQGPQIEVELILTDYHSDVLANLNHNVEQNVPLFSLPESSPHSLKVSVKALDWRDPERGDVAGHFDVVLGSDLVYEPRHAYWVADIVNRFLAIHKRTQAPEPAVPVATGVPEPKHSLAPPHLPRTPEPSRPNSPAHRYIKGSAVSSLLQPGSLPPPMPVALFHLMLPLRPTFIQESRAVHLAFNGSHLGQLDALNGRGLEVDAAEDPVGGDWDQVVELPQHDCTWEDAHGKLRNRTTSPARLNQQTSGPGRLKILKYQREEGASFGQGCGDYQYLTIGWDL